MKWRGQPGAPVADTAAAPGALDTVRAIADNETENSASDTPPEDVAVEFAEVADEDSLEFEADMPEAGVAFDVDDSAKMAETLQTEQLEGTRWRKRRDTRRR